MNQILEKLKKIIHTKLLLVSLAVFFLDFMAEFW